jgi:hypothetical protein
MSARARAQETAKRRIAFRLTLTAAAATAVIAGCTATSSSTAQQHSATATTTATGSSPAPKAAAVTLADLLSAPVPELCRHDPGKLVDGTLPHQDAAPGHVGIAKKPKPDTGYWAAFGDVTGDGVDDGALVTACDAGGMTGDLRWDGSKVVVENVKRTN